MSQRLRRWPLSVLIAVDQLLNAVAMGGPDDTISSRSWKAKIKGKLWGRIAVRVIDTAFQLIGQPDHCRQSDEWDEH